MKNSNMFRIMMAYAAIGMFTDFNHHRKSQQFKLTEDEIKDIRLKYLKTKQELMLKKGMKEFFYNGITIVALNQKNADRKYHNFLNTIEK